jgi:glycosyltransferase involved in cell wall biosynthesis
LNAAQVSGFGLPGSLDIVASNIQGTGAIELVLSLLPALERVGAARIGRIWIPAHGRLNDTVSAEPVNTTYRHYRRVLPNAVSRLVECLLAAPFVYGRRDLLVLGDLPLRAGGRQIVFVHTPFLVAGAKTFGPAGHLKAKMLRATFRANMRRAHRIIVQTQVMAEAIAKTYPPIAGNIRVIAQPPPAWLSDKMAGRRSRLPGAALNLFYPAAHYPHKNHRLLTELTALPHIGQSIAELVVTIDADKLTDPRAPLRAVGHLDHDGMRGGYAAADALLFPSLEESYGLPLVEAMHLGLPILCSDRPFAHALCGPQAIYFDPLDPASLQAAIEGLKRRLDDGWRPDWSDRLRIFPSSWDEVAKRMLDLFDEA